MTAVATRSRRSLLAPLGAALAVAGCVSVPERAPGEAGVEAPDAWAAESKAEPARATEVDGDWLASFHDGRLRELISEALGGNRELGVARARVEQAEARSRIVGADRLPEVGLELNGTRQNRNFIGFPFGGSGSDDGPPSATFETYDASVIVSWEPDLWGRVKAGRMAAAADVEAAEKDLYGAQLSVAARTARAWFAALEAELQTRLSRETVDSFERSERSVRSRYVEGVGSALDLRLLTAQRAAAEGLLAQREEQSDRALRRLEVLLGRYPSGALELEGDLPRPPRPVPAGMPAGLIARRPDLAAAERRLYAADARAIEARRALYPSFRLSASGGTSSEELGDLLDGDFSVWSVLASLAQPIFQGGRLRANVALRDAEASEALAGFADAALRAYSEVESALSAELRLAEREDRLREAAESSVAARALAEREYREGLSDVLTLFVAQRQALVDESTYLTARRERLDNRIDLVLALGGAPDGALPAAAASREASVTSVPDGVAPNP